MTKLIGNVDIWYTDLRSVKYLFSSCGENF